MMTDPSPAWFELLLQHPGTVLSVATACAVGGFSFARLLDNRELGIRRAQLDQMGDQLAFRDTQLSNLRALTEGQRTPHPNAVERRKEIILEARTTASRIRALADDGR